MLDKDCKYGHVTDTGLDAKYIGIGCCNSCLIFLVEGKTVSITQSGAYMHRPSDFKFTSIINKSAPSEWMNLYRNGFEFRGCVSNSYESAINNKAKHLPGGFLYHSTVEVQLHKND